MVGSLVFLHNAIYVINAWMLDGHVEVYKHNSVDTGAFTFAMFDKTWKHESYIKILVLY